jgi:hypothetical protein
MQVRVVVLKSGISILGELLGDVNFDTFYIRNPVEVSMGSIKDEGANISFFPFLNYTVEANESGLPINKNDVLFCLNPIKELNDHYTSLFDKDSINKFDEPRMEMIDPSLQTR